MPAQMAQLRSAAPLCQPDSTKAVSTAAATRSSVSSAGGTWGQKPPSLPSRAPTRPAFFRRAMTLRTRAALVQMLSASASLESVQPLTLRYTSAWTATLKSLFMPFLPLRTGKRRHARFPARYSSI